jgi:hypothetical protein
MRIGEPQAPPAGDGAAAGAPAPAGTGTAGPDAAGTDAAGAGGAADAAAEPCPQCGTARTGQFCESCGFNFATGRPAAGSPAAAASQAGAGPGAAAGGAAGSEAAIGAQDAGAGQPPGAAPVAGAAAPGAGVSGADRPVWWAVATADRAYFDHVIADGGPDAAAIEFPHYCPERRFRLTGGQMRIGRRSVSRGLEPEIDLTGPPADPGISHLHAVLLAQPDGGWLILDPGSANGTMVNDAEIEQGTRVPLHDGDRVCLGGFTVLTIVAA